MASTDANSGSPGGGVAGFAIGAVVGSAFGIAGLGTAIAGTLPIGILGAWLGYRHGARAMVILEQVSKKNSKEIKDWLRKVIDGALDAVFPDAHNRNDSRTCEERIDEIPIQLLAFQLGLAGSQPPLMGFTDRAADDWSIGYVWSFKAAFIQWSGGGPDVDGFASMAMMFIMLYGQGRGAELCGRTLHLQENHHFAKTMESSVFTQGLKAGWRDAMDWLTSRGEKPPLRWFEHVNQDLRGP